MRGGIKNQAGFTLTELLILIAVIGILALIVINSIGSAQSRARDSKRRQDISSIRKALIGHSIDTGTALVPNSGKTSGGTTGLGWFNFKGAPDYTGDTIEEGLRALGYVGVGIIDPREGANGYVIWPCAAADTIGVFAKLESPSALDQQTQSKWTTAGCSTAPLDPPFSRNYVLTVPLTN